jgi:exopolysaccharide biosynthesis WecB/TagA/CpsF family protein
MKALELAGLKIHPFWKGEFLELVLQAARAKKKLWVTTLYSEFLFAALKDKKVKQMLNKADVALLDGIGLVWAHRFLAAPLLSGSYFLKLVIAFGQALLKLFLLLKSSQTVDPVLKERLPGSVLIWDLAAVAERENLSIYLLGGFGDTPEKTATQLLKKFPRLNITGVSSKNPDQPEVIPEIKAVQPDFLFVAYGPFKQEVWIEKHLESLPVKLVMGVGGSFDYISGERKKPFNWVRVVGLEWLWRLVTQPYRIKRIFNATIGFVFAMIIYKVQITLPYRQNVVCVILNEHNQVFLGLRRPDKWPRNNNHWMMPQGGVEAGELVQAAAEREVWEETGMRSLAFLKISKEKNNYDWPLGFSTRFRGQEQQIAYFKFLGPSEEIDLHGHYTKEFIDFKWVPLSQLHKEVHELRSGVAKIAQEDLKDLA